jgi:hypothetical protein
LLPQTVSVGEELFSEQSVFGGVFTKYEVTKNGVPANENEYSIIDGKLILKANGTFDVKMTNKAVLDGYFDDLAAVLITLKAVNVDVHENTLTNFNIYPNPAIDKFVVEYGSSASIILYDMLGKEVLKQNIYDNTEIAIDKLPKGVYCINVISEGKMVGNSKIVKQ